MSDYDLPTQLKNLELAIYQLKMLIQEAHQIQKDLKQTEKEAKRAFSDFANNMELLQKKAYDEIKKAIRDNTTSLIAAHDKDLKKLLDAHREKVNDVLNEWTQLIKAGEVFAIKIGYSREEMSL